MIRTTRKLDDLSTQLTIPSLVYQGVSRTFLKAFPAVPSEYRYNITICNEKRFLWFRVAKVGTRSIFNLFEKSDLVLDAEHPYWCHYPLGVYQNYFKFAFVRNPWDRLVSCWLNKVANSNHFGFNESTLSKMQNFAYFINYLEGLDLNNCDNHIRSQSKLIDLNNIDFLGRFENFEEDLLKVADILEIKQVEINKKNSSKNRNNYKNYYTQELADKVAELYKVDINLFSYNY